MRKRIPLGDKWGEQVKKIAETPDELLSVGSSITEKVGITRKQVCCTVEKSVSGAGDSKQVKTVKISPREKLIEVGGGTRDILTVAALPEGGVSITRNFRPRLDQGIEAFKRRIMYQIAYDPRGTLQTVTLSTIKGMMPIAVFDKETLGTKFSLPKDIPPKFVHPSLRATFGIDQYEDNIGINHMDDVIARAQNLSDVPRYRDRFGNIGIMLDSISSKEGDLVEEEVAQLTIPFGVNNFRLLSVVKSLL